jgi:Protein of unknown function (DUF3800)
MILLYVDESGNHESRDEHFVVGGLAVHEADLGEIRDRVAAVVDRNLDPSLRNVEIHANAIANGRGVWRSVPKPVRQALLTELCREIVAMHSESSRRFALFAVVKEPGSVPRADPVERTFEEVYLRFNGFLTRQELCVGPELGLVVADDAKYEKVLQPITALS